MLICLWSSIIYLCALTQLNCGISFEKVRGNYVRIKRKAGMPGSNILVCDVSRLLTPLTTKAIGRVSAEKAWPPPTGSQFLTYTNICVDALLNMGFACKTYPLQKLGASDFKQIAIDGLTNLIFSCVR